MLSACVLPPSAHHHADVTPAYPVVTTVTQTHVQRNIVRYQRDCDNALSHNQYVPACDEYLQITSAPRYEHNNEILQTRLRFLRHRHRNNRLQQQRLVPQALVDYQRQCDEAIAQQQYAPACDQYVQLSGASRYRDNRHIHSTRSRYLEYKKRYKKSLRHIRMYKPAPKHTSAGAANSPYDKYKQVIPRKKTHTPDKRILQYQHRCESSLAQKKYSSDCDKYLQLTDGKKYHSDKKVRKLRKRYWRHKKQYQH